MAILFVDTETRSAAALKTGVYSYTECPEFGVMVIAWALDDGPVRIIDLMRPTEQDYTEFLCALNSPSNTIVAHNAQFDRIVLNASIATTPIERWHCTMARAMAHSLPGSLDKLCAIMRVPLDKAKDKGGKGLVKLFCIPKPKTNPGDADRWRTRSTHPADWRKFLDYASNDIEALRVLYKKLPRWNFDSREIAIYHLDQRINDRGIRVDLDLANAAIEAAGAEQRRLSTATRRLTDNAVTSTTQRDTLIRHILAVFDVTLPDLQAGTVERRLDDPEIPEPVKDLLKIRLMASRTSSTKYKTLLNSACADGRLRALLAYCGALRTGRWAGRGFQPQNLMRTPKHLSKIMDHVIRSIVEGTLDLWCDNVMEALAAATRGALIASEGKRLICADLSNIEGRVAAWLAGEEWKIKAFADFDNGEGEDLYVLGYARSFGVSPAMVNEDYEAGGNWRLIGKIGELACTYQGANGAFDAMAKAYNLDLETERITQIVQAWRAANPRIVQTWYDLQDAAIRAIALAGAEIRCGRLVLKRQGAWLKIRLPSGRSLSYPHPQFSVQWAMCFKCTGEGTVAEHDRVIQCSQCNGKGKVQREVLSYMGVNQYTRKWERVQTYGGKFFEQLCQSISRDILANTMIEAEKSGYDILLTAHDELITEAPISSAKHSAEKLSALMSRAPAWAAGLPLAAKGYEAQRYRKD